MAHSDQGGPEPADTELCVRKELLSNARFRRFVRVPASALQQHPYKTIQHRKARIAYRSCHGLGDQMLPGSPLTQQIESTNMRFAVKDGGHWFLPPVEFRPMIDQQEKAMDDNLKMLLIDDDEFMARSFTVVIRRAFQGRINLTALTDPVAAQSWTNRNSPDLVLTDIEMPAVDGFEILKCAKRRNPYCQVIIHSAYFSPEALRRALKLEATGYILKSAGPKEVLDVLEHAYRRVLRWTQALASVVQNG